MTALTATAYEKFGLLFMQPFGHTADKSKNEASKLVENENERKKIFLCANFGSKISCELHG